MIKRSLAVVVTVALSAVALVAAVPVDAAPVAGADNAASAAAAAGHAQAGRTSGSALSPAVAAPRGYSVRGVDVSQFNETVDWSAVAGSNVKFAFVRAGTADEGKQLLTDTSYATNLSGARGAGLLTGAYYFARPDTEDVGTTATQQADHFAQLLAGKTFDLPAFLDLEKADPKSGPECWHRSQDSMARWVGQFVSEFIAKVGYAPMIYSSQSFWNDCVGTNSSFDDLALNVATYASAPKLPSGFTHYEFWQYTDDATDVNGRAQTCGDGNDQICPIDGDVFNGSLGELQAFGRNRPGPGAATVAGAGGSYHVFGTQTTGAVTQGVYASGHGWSWQPTGTGGAVRGTPGVTYTASTNRYDVFAVGTSGAVYQKTFAGSWGAWHSIGGRDFAGGLAAVIGNGGTYRVFGLTRSGFLWVGLYNPSAHTWSWQNIGSEGAVVGTPAVRYDASTGQYEVLASGRNGQLYRKVYAVGWGRWTTIGGSNFAGGAGTAGVEHVFAVNAAGILYHGLIGGTGNWNYQNLGGTVVGTPGARYTAAGNRYDVFAASPNGSMYQKYYAAGRWSGWSLIGGSNFA